MKTYRLHNPLEHGDDLKPLQEALKVDGVYNGAIDGTFGQGTGQACVTIKFRLGYPKRLILPIGGQILLDYLTGKKKLPLAYRIRRHKRGFGIRKIATKRQVVVRWARWGIANQQSIHYTESTARDDWLTQQAGHLPMFTDCSGFVTACYKWAGANDPNGLFFRAVGFTGTLLDHGVTIPLHDALAGDVVIWYSAREPSGHHTALLIEDGSNGDPMISSNGGENGPLEEKLSAETAAQARPYVIKRYL